MNTYINTVDGWWIVSPINERTPDSFLKSLDLVSGKFHVFYGWLFNPARWSKFAPLWRTPTYDRIQHLIAPTMLMYFPLKKNKKLWIRRSFSHIENSEFFICSFHVFWVIIFLGGCFRRVFRWGFPLGFFGLPCSKVASLGGFNPSYPPPRMPVTSTITTFSRESLQTLIIPLLLGVGRPNIYIYIHIHTSYLYIVLTEVYFTFSLVWNL